MRPRTKSQAGFSLVELLVALVVTLLIAGGIFGLLFDGSNTFGREPLLTEQQQNIRIAMAMIEGDLVSAGAGAGGLAQVFTPGFDDQAADSQGGATPQSVLVPGDNPDVLEMRVAVEDCPTMQFCAMGGPTGTDALTKVVRPACMRVPGLVQISAQTLGHSVTMWACPSTLAALGTCSGPGLGAPHERAMSFVAPGAMGCQGQGQQCNATGFNGISGEAFVTAINMVRYEIRLAADGVPSLWRSPTGIAGATAVGACALPGGAGADWQLVARGIEDLQVRYRVGGSDPNDPTTWPDEPPAMTCLSTGCAPLPAHWDEVVREVEVRLSARAVTARRLQGETNQGGVRARRTQIYTRIAPRAALLALQAANQYR